MKVVEPMVTTFGGIWASMGYCNFQTLEYMHERVRKDLWGYVIDEHIDKEGLIKEAYPEINLPLE